MAVPFSECHTSRIILYVPFQTGYCHLATCTEDSTISFMAWQLILLSLDNISHCMAVPRFNHSPTERHFDWFQFFGHYELSNYKSSPAGFCVIIIFKLLGLISWECDYWTHGKTLCSFIRNSGPFLLRKKLLFLDITRHKNINGCYGIYNQFYLFLFISVFPKDILK